MANSSNFNLLPSSFVLNLLIDNHNLTQFVPQWYPKVCIAYDIVMALYIALKCIETEENNPFIN